MDEDTIRQQVLALVTALPADIQAQAASTNDAKGMVARMLPFFHTVAELASSNQIIPTGAAEERHASFQRLVSHVEKLWEDAIALFARRSYPSALFLAIVALEELGKVAIARIQVVLGVPTGAAIVGVGPRGSLLRSHPKKHVLAVGAGAVVNSRLDRLVGLPKLIAFIEQAETGELERRRQDCLYYDIENGHQHLPYDEISREDAELVLTIVGELLAEVGSVIPDESDRLLGKVTEFEIQHTTIRDYSSERA